MLLTEVSSFHPQKKNQKNGPRGSLPAPSFSLMTSLSPVFLYIIPSLWVTRPIAVKLMAPGDAVAGARPSSQTLQLTVRKEVEKCHKLERLWGF